MGRPPIRALSGCRHAIRGPAQESMASESNQQISGPGLSTTGGTLTAQDPPPTHVAPSHPHASPAQAAPSPPPPPTTRRPTMEIPSSTSSPASSSGLSNAGFQFERTDRRMLQSGHSDRETPERGFTSPRSSPELEQPTPSQSLLLLILRPHGPSHGPPPLIPPRLRPAPARYAGHCSRPTWRARRPTCPCSVHRRL